MKTLDEEIRDIKNMKGSKSLKKEALVKLGLRKHEIDIVLADLPKPVSTRYRFTFGVEIECLVPARVMRECAERNGRQDRQRNCIQAYCLSGDRSLWVSFERS